MLCILASQIDIEYIWMNFLRFFSRVVDSFNASGVRGGVPPATETLLWIFSLGLLVI